MSVPILNGDGNLIRRVAEPFEGRDDLLPQAVYLFRVDFFGEATRIGAKQSRKELDLLPLIMARLTARNVNNQVVRARKRRTAAHGRSAEAEHRETLSTVLLEKEENFTSQVKSLRNRLRSSIDSSDVIRADRDRDISE